MYIKDERPRVPTPVPTPTASPSQSVSQHVSPPVTPQLSEVVDLVQLPPAQPVLPAAEPAESLTDDAGDFPSYEGVYTRCHNDLHLHFICIVLVENEPCH